MEQISYHGNKIFFSITGILVLSLCTVLATYRLKKTAEIKHWKKALALYSKQLEQENQIAKSESYPEVR